jgi:hypothetical protein
MSRFSQRLSRELGTIWPNDEQQLVLQAIFASPERACEAYQAWRDRLDIEQNFDGAVMRLLPLLYLRLLQLGLNDPLTGRLKGVYRRVWSETHALFHGTAPALSAPRSPLHLRRGGGQGLGGSGMEGGRADRQRRSAVSPRGAVSRPGWA